MSEHHDHPPATGQPDDAPATTATTATTPTDGFSRRDFIQHAAAAGALAAGCSPRRNTTPAEEEKKDAPAPAEASTKMVLHINGKKHEVALDPRVTLLDALREYLGLPGSRKGCDHGQCGACTVLIDGRRVYSCLTLAAAAAGGAKVTTIEGLAEGDRLHPLQTAFIERDAFQCGYCTSGQICSGVGLINEGRARTDDDIREQMAGNLCRCGAYPNIVAAVRDAQQQLQKAAGKE